MDDIVGSRSGVGGCVGCCGDEVGCDERYFLDSTLDWSAVLSDGYPSVRREWFRNRVCAIMHQATSETSVVANGGREGSDWKATLDKTEGC